MRSLSQASEPASSNKSDSLSCILDSFKINHHQYLVVQLTGQSPPDLFPNLPDYNLAHCQEISRFAVDGHPCVVLRVEQDNASNTEDLTLLLTERELQIATLVAMGRPNKQIASHLRISEWTVSTHLRRVFMKLGVDSRAAMVYRCAFLIQQTTAH